MKIHFMKEEALIYFKNNVESNIKHYLDQDNQWIYEKYAKYKGSEESPFAVFKLEVPEFQLDMTAERPESTDCTNVQILYNALKGISDTQASDERFWVGLAHSELWEYMQYRCKYNKDTLSVGKIQTNFFYNNGQKRSLILHPLARMWWVGRLTYDSTQKEPYGALAYMQKDFSTKALSFFSSNFTNNPIIARSILNALSELESDGIKVTREAYLETIRYVNYLGGIVILDYLTEEELKRKIKNHFYEVNHISVEKRISS